MQMIPGRVSASKKRVELQGKSMTPLRPQKIPQTGNLDFRREHWRNILGTAMREPAYINIQKMGRKAILRFMAEKTRMWCTGFCFLPAYPRMRYIRLSAGSMLRSMVIDFLQSYRYNRYTGKRTVCMGNRAQEWRVVYAF